jgi:hypothetical protein
MCANTLNRECLKMNGVDRLHRWKINLYFPNTKHILVPSSTVAGYAGGEEIFDVQPLYTTQTHVKGTPASGGVTEKSQ